MTVNPTQNPGIPASTQAKATDITDGASNTIAIFPKKMEKLFSKDSFETSPKSYPPEMQPKIEAREQKQSNDPSLSHGEATGLVAEGNLYAGFLRRAKP